jgi:hypothetical protein
VVAGHDELDARAQLPAARDLDEALEVAAFVAALADRLGDARSGQLRGWVRLGPDDRAASSRRHCRRPRAVSWRRQLALALAESFLGIGYVERATRAGIAVPRARGREVRAPALPRSSRACCHLSGRWVTDARGPDELAAHWWRAGLDIVRRRFAPVIVLARMIEAALAQAARTSRAPRRCCRSPGAGRRTARALHRPGRVHLALAQLAQARDDRPRSRAT